MNKINLPSVFAAGVVTSFVRLAAAVLLLKSAGIAEDEPDALSSRSVSTVQAQQISVKDLGMDRCDIARPDSTQWIFNGSGRCIPRRWSITGFTGLGFVHEPDGYRFRFDFLEKRSGGRIVDNVNEVIDGKSGDPLGWNFRAGQPFCIVPQKDTWYPHFERRTGSFHKNFATGMVSFAIESRVIVPARPGEVLIEISIENRDASELTLTLLPIQNGVNTLNGFVTDLGTIKGQGLEWTIPPHTSQMHTFAVGPFGKGKEMSETYQPNLRQFVDQADRDGETQIRRIAGALPNFQTSNRNLSDLYKRCIVGLAFSRFDYPGCRVHPIWLASLFNCVVAWDFSFVGDTMSVVDPHAVRQIVADVLGIGQMQSSYIALDSPKSLFPILYIQDPFALQELITSYIKFTNDRTILDDTLAGHTVYDWLKLWAAKLDSYPKGAGGLIDMRDDGNENLLELRTDGYDHVVPTVNGLAIRYLRWLAELARERNDPDSGKFEQQAAAMVPAFHALWDENAGWFDNVYEDGSKQPIFTMHLFDLLGTPLLTAHERQAIGSHFVEGEFLAPLGIYSISKKDSVHWDRFDQDWGGGGCYIGTPFRTARYLYENGEAGHAWEVLKRTARLAAHFSYLPQSACVDESFEDIHGGKLNIANAAALECIWSGIFGLRPQLDGRMVVAPAPFNAEIGKAILSDFQFRQHRYDVELLSSGWRVSLDGKLWSENKYGETVEIPAQQPRQRASASF